MEQFQVGDVVRPTNASGYEQEFGQVVGHSTDGAAVTPLLVVVQDREGRNVTTPRFRNWPSYYTLQRVEPRPKTFLDDKPPIIDQYPNFAPYVGTDPEIFVEVEGKVAGAWKFLSAKKENHYTFWDGFQAEFTVPARSCLQELGDGIRNGLLRVQERARKALGSHAKLTIDSVREVPLEDLMDAEEQFVMLACSPSKNVYNAQGASVPAPRSLPIRFAGGHIHIGVGDCQRYPDFVDRVVRCMDGLVGVASVSLAAGLERPERREFYGLAGEYRLPKHGIEYRVLSNYWLGHPAIYMLTFELARLGAKLGQLAVGPGLLQMDEREVQDIINGLDVEAAKKYLLKRRELIVGLLRGKFVRKDMAESAFSALMNGAASVVKDPKAVERNWCLDGQTWRPNCGNSNAMWSHLQNSYLSKGLKG